jgi:hypothetical protein
MLALLIKCIVKCAIEMFLGAILSTSIPSFMKTGRGVQVRVRFRLSNLKGSNAGITYGRDYDVRH